MGFEFVLTNTDLGLLEYVSGELCVAGYHPIIDSRVQDPNRLGYYREKCWRLSTWRKAEVCRILSWTTPRHGEKNGKAQFVREICGLANCPGMNTVEVWGATTREIRSGRDRFIAKAQLELNRRNTARRIGPREGMPNNCMNCL